MFIVKTRPDILFAVSRLATRTSGATEKDFSALLRVVSYLHGTRTWRLRFRRDLNASLEELTRLFAFVDAAHATNKDSTSQTGEFFCLALGPLRNFFFGRSFKEGRIKLSSCEAEHEGYLECVLK